MSGFEIADSDSTIGHVGRSMAAVKASWHQAFEFPLEPLL